LKESSSRAGDDMVQALRKQMILLPIRGPAKAGLYDHAIMA
jgi:hypothetical protein